ncbi:PilT/PilU family type 4a pilus ATPase [Patescibacteria group bacterium]|nr:PilT/PilU family type 4a pilus ATPase [Patescibacteria group bacterium]MBU1722082.1 PilT/PilU family type 4a pilus ATPase [Patescibacteria group bacterium]MBU1901362.1 PilT/PilU family type 4a pilus ATPase [Patescibacteria group bacterium]
MKSIQFYFAHAVKQGASDVHLVGGKKPSIRIHGILEDVETKLLKDSELRTVIASILSSAQKKQLEKGKELDMSHAISDGTRFRINVHFQEGNIALAARLIPENIPSPEELAFEPALNGFTDLLDGLVLVVGPTGQGKSTTIASMIEQINQKRKAHIITIEDPIEFLFQDDKSLIEQREIGEDTHSFSSALKHVLRQDPDVIFVGEMRDPETIATVLTAAETGHLVFSTLHTATAAEAVERIVDVFEGPKQRQVLIQLSAVLRGVVAQHLLPASSGGRVAAREILINTPAVSNLIRENNIVQLKSVIQTNAKIGMIPMDTSIDRLLKDNKITDDMAEKRSGRQRKI